MPKKKAKLSPKKENKPAISVKINESSRIDDSEFKSEKDLSKEKEESKVKERQKEEKLSFCSIGKYIVIGVIVILAAWLGYVFLQQSAPNGQQTYKFPQLRNDTMVCDDKYLCFMYNGTWNKIGYSMGTSLTAANNLKASNEAEIHEFFKRDKINIVFGSVNSSDPANAQLILTSTPFSYYLGVFYSYEKRNVTITPYLLNEYNSTEPALIILGPGLGANETSLTYDGKNVVAQGATFSDLGMVLGKLLIVAIKE